MAQYARRLQPANFVLNEDTGLYTVTISTGTLSGHGFNNTAFLSVIKVSRETSSGGSTKNVIFSYEVDPDGNLYLYFNEPFTGRLAIMSDEAQTA